MNKYDLAGHFLEEALAFYQNEDDQNMTFFSNLALGILSWKKGNIQVTALKVVEASAVARDMNKPWVPVILLGFQWALDRAGGDEAGAEACLIKAIRISREIGPVVREDLSRMLAQSKAVREPEKAARLFGAAEPLHKDDLGILAPLGRTWQEEALGEVKAALGEQRMADLWAEGRAMTFEAVNAYALEGVDGE